MNTTIIAFIIIIGIPFWLWMLADAIMIEHKKRHHGHFWVIFIAVTFIIGAIIYYFIKKRGK